MEGGAPTTPAGIQAFMDANTETISVVALATVAALAKAWQSYNERPAPKRIGRRGSDLDCELMQASQRKIEHDLEALASAVKELAATVRALETARQAGAAS
jgi:hypothetical protein